RPGAGGHRGLGSQPGRVCGGSGGPSPGAGRNGPAHLLACRGDRPGGPGELEAGRGGKGQHLSQAADRAPQHAPRGAGRREHGVKCRRWTAAVAALLFLGVLLVAGEASAQTVIPRLTIWVDQAESPEQVAVTLQILFLLTVLSLAPALLIMTTSFTRIVVVLSFVRSALATNQMPPNQVLIGLALFLTFFIMAPTWQTVSQEALMPYLAQEIGQDEAIARALEPIREFMFRHTRERDLALFLEMSGAGQPVDPSDVPTSALVPAFVIS